MPATRAVGVPPGIHQSPARHSYEKEENRLTRSRSVVTVATVLRRTPFGRCLRALSFLLATACGLAHPTPDVPVRGFFNSDQEARIEIEIDTRCFAADPNTEPYLTKENFDRLPPSKRDQLRETARAFATNSVAFFFEPTGQFFPTFEFHFSGPADAPLKNPDDAVMITGRWAAPMQPGLRGYRVEALSTGKLSVVVLNTLNGHQVERVHVLFPGETSYLLDLAGRSGPASMAPSPGTFGEKGGTGATFVDFTRQGFVHVFPRGVDHILFVLGLFLLCRQWRPLLWQVTMFTVAHTLTLGLATLGGLSVSPRIVEPVIAASIAVVALENVFHAKYTHWRLAVVFIFGLIHGLGFAGALQELDLPAASLVVGLLGFNLGVELGQLAVIGAAFAATFWLKREERYRRFVVVPGSLLIAAIGIWWTVARIAGR